MANRYSLSTSHPSGYREQIGHQFKNPAWFENTIRDERRDMVKKNQYNFSGPVYLLTFDEHDFFITWISL